MTSTTGPKLAAEIQRIVLARIENGRLVIPSMPRVAHACLATLRDPDFNQRKLVTQIESEPMLAALIVRAATTAAYGSARSHGIDQAVARLGAQRLKSLIVEYASRELFQSNDHRIAAANRRIWEHSLAVAHLARDIAAFAGSADTDSCYVAGLLHDIGKPIVASILLEAERRLSTGQQSWIDSDAWTNTVESVHRKVGVALATAWRLPDEVASAIRDCSDYDPSQRVSISNIVRLANAAAKREGFATGPVDRADLEAMILVGRSLLGADEDVVTRLTATLKERLATTDL